MSSRFFPEETQTLAMRLATFILLLGFLGADLSHARSLPIPQARSPVHRGEALSFSLNRHVVLGLFYRGKYVEALQLLNSLHGKDAKDKELRKVLEATVLEISGMTTYSTGKFLFLYEPGIDELLLPYVSQAAEKQYSFLAGFFNHEPPTPVRVEIVPTYQGFSALTGIDANTLRRVGATGMCKFGKIVILSPSALPAGYPYVHTLAHELVHYFLLSIASDFLPRWFHEGVATYLERVWAGEPRGRLSAPMASLLYEAVVLSKLISPERIKGETIEAQSPREAFLTYAQLAAFFAFLEMRFGEDIIPKLVMAASSIGNIDQAFVRITSVSWRNLWGGFGREMASFALKRQHLPSITWFDDSITALRGLSPEVESEIRLGDVYYGAKNFVLAIKHYMKARELSQGKEDPVLIYRLARTLLDNGEAKKAMEILSSCEISPDDFLPLWREWGRALFYTQRFEEAKTYLLHFLWTNPYDKVAHELLAETYARLGDRDGQELETKLSLMCE